MLVLNMDTTEYSREQVNDNENSFDSIASQHDKQGKFFFSEIWRFFT